MTRGYFLLIDSRLKILRVIESCGDSIATEYSPLKRVDGLLLNQYHFSMDLLEK